jgi:hypothetical protein
MSEEVSNAEEQAPAETVEQTQEQSFTEKSPTGFVENFLGNIQDDDVKGAGFWKNLEGKNETEVGRYIKELQSFAGKKGDIPKEDASEEEWNEFYQKLGRPESIEGYDFDVNDEFTSLVGEEEAQSISNGIAEFKEKAFKMGASAEQAEDLVNWYLGGIAETAEAEAKEQEEMIQEMENELRGKWGEGYDGMVSGIESMLTSHGLPEENLKIAKEAGLLSDPAFAVALGNIATRFQDDPEIGFHQQRTVAGLQDQLAEMEMEVANYISEGKKVPTHIATKRIELMKKLGDNL